MFIYHLVSDLVTSTQIFFIRFSRLSSFCYDSGCRTIFGDILGLRPCRSRSLDSTRSKHCSHYFCIVPVPSNFNCRYYNLQRNQRVRILFSYQECFVEIKILSFSCIPFRSYSLQNCNLKGSNSLRALSN